VTIDRTKTRVLVVEDEYFIARELVDALKQRGFEVVGAVPDVDRALSAVSEGWFDVAVLDLNLQDRADFRVADALAAKRIPFLFATGYDASIVPDRFADVLRFEKPYDPDQLINGLKVTLLKAG
jgi:DNA-binding response OmpR family regulator